MIKEIFLFVFNLHKWYLTIFSKNKIKWDFFYNQIATLGSILCDAMLQSSNWFFIVTGRENASLINDLSIDSNLETPIKPKSRMVDISSNQIDSSHNRRWLALEMHIYFRISEVIALQKVQKKARNPIISCKKLYYDLIIQVRCVFWKQVFLFDGKLQNFHLVYFNGIWQFLIINYRFSDNVGWGCSWNLFLFPGCQSTISPYFYGSNYFYLNF